MSQSMTRRDVCVGASAFAVSTVFAQPTAIVIKFSHVVAPNTPKGAAADFFAKRAAELTQGRVKVEVYPNSQLYKDKEVREFEVLDLPYIFPDKAALRTITTGPIGTRLLAMLEPKGFKGLAYRWPPTPRSARCSWPAWRPASRWPCCSAS